MAVGKTFPEYLQYDYQLLIPQAMVAAGGGGRLADYSPPIARLEQRGVLWVVRSRYGR